jgi:hypothetical protein
MAYRTFAGCAVCGGSTRWLYARAWLHDEPPSWLPVILNDVLFHVIPREQMATAVFTWQPAQFGALPA